MLELYRAERCPHSTEVRGTFTELGCSSVVHNPRLPGDEGSDELNEHTHCVLTDLGDDEIPFLVDTDRNETFSESERIVDYLEEHYG